MKKKRRKKPRPNRTVFWGVIFLITGGFFLAWWFWSCLYNVSPRLNFILIKKNEQHLKILNGETLYLHPKDKLHILKIATNICFNKGVRIVSRGFDVSALLYEEMPFYTLLPDGELFKQYKFRVDVKQYNHTLGHVNMIIEPHVEDWLDKAQRTINSSKRIAILKRALKLFPDNKQIRVQLIEEYKSSKRWQEAASMIEEIIKEKPDPENLYNLLEVYDSMSNTAGTISVLKRLLDKEPDNAELLYRLAKILEGSKKLKEAIKVYEKLLKFIKKQDCLPVYKALAYLYVETGQIKKAIAKYLKAAELDKMDVNLYYNLSNLYERIGEKEKANFFLKKAVGLKSEDIESRLKLAESLIAKGDLKEGEKYLREVLKRNPNSLEALLLMIKIAEKKGDKEELKEIYKKILSFDPKNETVIYNLGILEYETGHLSKSLPYFKTLAKLHPYDPQIRGLLFNIYRKTKKDSLAFKEAQALIKLNPKDIRYYHYAFEYLNSRGSYKKMIAIMKKGLISNPKNTDLREYLVLAYLKTGRENFAIEQMRQILKLKPKNVTILLQLARLQEKHENIKDALNSYKKILHISPGHPEAKEAYLRLLLKLAKLKEKKGNLNEALQAYKKVLDISPGHVEAEEAYIRLRLKGLTDGGKD